MNLKLLKIVRFFHLINKKKYNEKRQIEIVKASPLFDAKWYLAQNPDVKAKKIGAAKHYVKFGWKEGRNPSPDFDTEEYLAEYPELLEKNWCPLFHYMLEHRELLAKMKLSDIFTTINSLTDKLAEKFLYKGKDKNYILIARSKYFDKKWYLKQNMDVKKAGMDPIVHYMKFGWREGRNPSIFFDNDIYLYLNPDVKKAKMNPLIHYLRYGIRQNRSISFSDIKNTNISYEKFLKFSFEMQPAKTKRIAIYASFSPDRKIRDSEIYYLQGLKKVVDNIIYVSDSPIDKDEIKKLENLVCYTECGHHGEYDFGSYKRGYLYAEKKGLLKNIDELVICNSSCLGPIYPFSEMFGKMSVRKCDFWGFSSFNHFGIKHIQSFFYVFKKQVFKSSCFHNFFVSVSRQLAREFVVERYELRLTQYLVEHNFKYDAYIVMDKSPVKYPYKIIKENRAPLVKIKAVLGDHDERNNNFMNLIEKVNPELYAIIIKEFQFQIIQKRKNLEKKLQQIKTLNEKDYIKNIHEKYKQKVSELKNKVKYKKKINMYFLCYNTSMFAAKALFNETLNNHQKIFNPKIIVIPDLRAASSSNAEAEYKALIQEYGQKYVINPLGKDGCADISKDADICVFSTPYNLSHFYYNFNYLAEKGVLPIIINYGYYRSVYDRSVVALNAYNIAWLVSVETKYNMHELKKYSDYQAKNGILTGYTKMDDLKYYSKRNNKPTIMIAPHHSVEGGFNATLALSNFIKYSDFFLEIFEKHTKIEFIFRPHPMLFTALIKKNIWSKDKVEKYLQQIERLKNVRYSHSGDYFQDFADSDALINDCGSYLVEYFYTGKPQCYMLKKKADIKQKFSELGKQCLQNCYLAYTKEDIEKFIDDVIAQKHDIMKKQRLKFAQNNIMLNFPNASEILINRIEKELKQ